MVPVATRPRPVVPAPPIRAMPELTVARYSEPPTFSRPIGLLKLARASWPIVLFWPFEYTPVMVPSWAKLNDCNVPRAVPSCDSADALTVWPHWVRGWVALVRSTVTGMTFPLAVARLKLRLADALLLTPIGMA